MRRLLAFVLWLLDSLRAFLGRLAAVPGGEPSLADRVAPAGSQQASRGITVMGADGQPAEYQATGIHGLMLICRGKASNEVRYIDAGQTSDMAGFYRVWAELGGMGQGLLDETGQPFDPR